MWCLSFWITFRYIRIYKELFRISERVHVWSEALRHALRFETWWTFWLYNIFWCVTLFGGSFKDVRSIWTSSWHLISSWTKIDEIQSRHVQKYSRTLLLVSFEYLLLLSHSVSKKMKIGSTRPRIPEIPKNCGTHPNTCDCIDFLTEIAKRQRSCQTILELRNWSSNRILSCPPHVTKLDSLSKAHRESNEARAKRLSFQWNLDQSGGAVGPKQIGRKLPENWTVILVEVYRWVTRPKSKNFNKVEMN